MAALALSCLAAPAAAQIRPTLIRDATILTGDGRTIERGGVLMQGGKITDVGEKVEGGLLARTISARGKFVTPGFIDCHSTLTITSPAGGDPLARAADAFDSFALDDLNAALRQGITTAYIPARAANGAGGRGSVVSLRPGAPRNEAVRKADESVSIGFNADGSTRPLARARTYADLRALLIAVKDYRRAWEDYADDLTEYEKKLEELRKKNAEAGKSAASAPAKGADSKPAAKPGRGAGNPKSEKPADKPAEKPEGRKSDKPADGAGDKDKADEKKEGPKKPTQPDNNRGFEWLLKLLDGEVVMRAEAHEPADIVNALDLAAEFNAAIVLEGASAADRFADQLVDRKIPVVLSAPPAPLGFRPGAAEWDEPRSAARLAAAGVDVYFGSGAAAPGGMPHLSLRAARAVGFGLGENAALASLTGRAARLLGIEDDVGRVASGLQADLVIWSAHPFAPDAVVERVFIAGREVYRADDAGAD